MNVDTAKQYFETGDFPTQGQFAQVLDWLRFSDVKIAESDLTPALIAKINTAANRPERKVFIADTTIVMPAETRLVNVAIKNPGPTLLEFHIYRIALGVGAPWYTMIVNANSSADFLISNLQPNNTFWADETMTLIEDTGNLNLAFPPIILIDRR